MVQSNEELLKLPVDLNQDSYNAEKNRFLEEGSSKHISFQEKIAAIEQKKKAYNEVIETKTFETCRKQVSLEIVERLSQLVFIYQNFI